MAYIIRQEEIAKKKLSEKRPRMVGGIRHKEPFQCMVGLIAMNLFVSLQCDRSMSFLCMVTGFPLGNEEEFFKDGQLERQAMKQHGRLATE